MRSRLFLITVGVLALPRDSAAQNYRVRVDASAQAVAFRGLERDSIDAAAAVTGMNGGQETPDGYAVRCSADGFCRFLRPGRVRRGMPLTTSASVVMWGLGVEGLAFHATGRLVADAGRDRVWPGTSPAGQLIEGYLEYQRATIVARAGRQPLTSRIEAIGFDGGLLKVRVPKAALELSGYTGRGLGQAAALVATSPALNPLDEWRPRKPQIVSGVEATWVSRTVDLRAEYRREIDPEDNYFVAERSSLSGSARVARLRAVGGVDYNLAEGHMGNADIALTYVRPKVTMSAGARRYRPFFSLWTLWGAFSPVPYNAVNASAQIRPLSWLSLQGRGEQYRYESAEISTGVVPPLQDRGWRASTTATATLNPRWTADVTYSLESGPGASGRFADGAIAYARDATHSVSVYGGTMARPLELRYYDATSRWIGARADWQRNAQRRIAQQRWWADIAFVTDERERPDAGASSLSQVRVRAGLSLVFGSKADRLPLPPARRSGT